MNKLFVIGAVLLTLGGCEKAAAPAPQAVTKQKPAEVPRDSGQYLRFIRLPSGETRLQLVRVVGQVQMVTSGYPGFSVEPGQFPEVNPLTVGIKDCGLITFTKSVDNPKAMTAVRTEINDYNDQCPIQKIDGLWIQLSVDA
ncbi:hypothetical protein [Pseudomonas sp. MF4836]|jgi:hypothetical protein|uniref:hypothetical protein n=1 Tax=Pseudomonas sp. MF4836 TaxID=1960827 RepID=UPI000996D618|nr:hypothetical protein [Pseudomonas sp. MF4836]OOV89107.1 hypothetical protein MF4836_34415 [Pseudomonas sp. MF4836]